MPVAIVGTPDLPAALDPPRKRLTRAECAVLESSGLWDGQHWELIEGELINKMGKNQPHVIALVRMQQWLVGVFGWARVYPEAPIDVAPEDTPTSEPEPDLIVRTTTSNERRPQPAELALVVEVSDTTLKVDLIAKAGLYARAGIVDYWVMDLNGRRMIVHRQPEQGSYKSVVAYSQQERVAPLAAPDREFLVAGALA